jgi:hypothetical protein
MEGEAVMNEQAKAAAEEIAKWLCGLGETSPSFHIDHTFGMDDEPNADDIETMTAIIEKHFGAGVKSDGSPENTVLRTEFEKQIMRIGQLLGLLRECAGYVVVYDSPVEANRELRDGLFARVDAEIHKGTPIL